MLLKYFYDSKLAHASYLVGCQRSGVACIVDPGRYIEPYLETAKREGLRITTVAETHIHADYVSGARELADRVGAKLYVSDEGPAEWKYLYLDEYDHHSCKDADTFDVGKIRFEVVHTPGHTPESLSLLLTDRGGGATTPMGVFTGDFVFVGSIGRPDLLEEAAGVAGAAEPGARDLYKSIGRFRDLADHLQVWPAHGAGSACGKDLGAIPSSTVGYEKLYNPALQHKDEESFVQYILADQPEAPKYFAVMKRVNKEGPKVLGPGSKLPVLSINKLGELNEQVNLVDTRPSSDFARGHAPGSINIPLTMLAPWAGWLVDYDRPTYLIGSPERLDEAARTLHKIGCDDLRGAFDAGELVTSGEANEQYSSGAPTDLESAISNGDVYLVDVRSNEEWSAGHIEQAHHHFLGRLPDSASSIPQDAPVVVHCQSGARSAIGVSVLQAAGHKNVTNLTGGYSAWTKAGLLERISKPLPAS